MAKIALKDAIISETTASGHITYRTWEQDYYVNGYCNETDEDGNCIDYVSGYWTYHWVNHTTSAKVKGDCNASSNSVYINGKNAVLRGNSTSENDSYTIPSGGSYVGGSHSSANGSVSSGNSRNVYINGVSVAVIGSSVSTHAGTTATITSGSSNVYIGG